MSPTIELSEEFLERVDSHREEEVSREQFLTEVLDHYETEGRFLEEGYGGAP